MRHLTHGVSRLLVIWSRQVTSSSHASFLSLSHTMGVKDHPAWWGRCSIRVLVCVDGLRQMAYEADSAWPAAHGVS